MILSIAPACMMALALGAQSSKPAPPTLAVMPLQAKGGMDQNAADLITARMVTALRDHGRFSRVVDNADMQALLGFEEQKQLLNCDSSSCMAELAGALGVDMVMATSAGQLGDAWVINVSLVDTRTARALASVSRTLRDGSVADLLDQAPAAAMEAVDKAGIGSADGSQPVAAVAPTQAADPAPTPQAAVEPETAATQQPAAAPPSGTQARPQKRGPLTLAVRGAGVGLVAMGLAGIPALLLAVATGAGTWATFFLAPDLALGAPGRGWVVTAGFYGGGAMAVLTSVLGLAFLSAGGVVLALAAVLL